LKKKLQSNLDWFNPLSRF